MINKTQAINKRYSELLLRDDDMIIFINKLEVGNLNKDKCYIFYTNKGHVRHWLSSNLMTAKRMVEELKTYYNLEIGSWIKYKKQ